MPTPPNAVPGAAPPGLERAAPEPGPTGHHIVQGRDRATLHLLLLDGAAPDQPLAALVPIDADAPERLDAIARLLRSLGGGQGSPDTRLTLQRRRRIRSMLQALDGRAAGASERDIATVLYGRRRVTAELWHDSSLRYAIRRLLRDGKAMVAGGYRDLLRHRRRP